MKRAALNIEGAKITVAVASVIPSMRMTVLKRMEVTMPETEQERTGELKKLLSTLHDDYGVKGVSIGLEPALFTHTFVDLPVSGRTDVAHALTFELGKYLPLPPEEYVLDFHTWRTDSGGSHNLIVSARKEKLGWIARALEGTGLSLLGLKCTAFEVLNDLLSTRGSGSCLFIYQGAASAAAITLKDFAPLSLSFRPLGEDAASIVRQMIEGHEEDVLVTGVEGTPAYTGDRISTLKITPTDALLHSAGGRKSFDLDFTPPELSTEKTNRLPHVMAGLAVICVLVFFLTSVLAYYRDSSALGTVQERLMEIRTSSEGLVEIKRETEVLHGQIGFLREFRAKSNRHINLLNRLSRILPESAWLTSFTANDTDTVEIKGFATRTAKIIRPLEQSKEFSMVEFSTPITVRDDVERFSIKMSVHP